MVVAIARRLAASTVVVLLTCALGEAQICVPDDYETIQEAIDVAVASDIILVEPGTYVENLDFGGLNISLRSTDGPGVTTIDGSDLTLGDEFGSTVNLFNGEEAGIEGFTITGGTGTEVDTGGDTIPVGGGIYCFESFPSLIDVIVVFNESTRGGGIYIEDSDVTLENVRIEANEGVLGGGVSINGDSEVILTDCRIDDNEATGLGGGVLISDAATATLTATGTTIQGNTAGLFGGGIYSQAEITLTDSVLADNSCTIVGGAAYLKSNAAFENCEIRGNVAANGAGIFAEDSAVTFDRCLFWGNDTGGEGGAFASEDAGSSGGTSASFTHCTFGENSAERGSAVRVDDSTSEATLLNCIAWGNGDDALAAEDGEIEVTYSAIEGGFDGDGNIDEDPLFASPASGVFLLREDSPCIDAGDRDSPDDPDGTTADMGAFPYVPVGFLRGDVNGDGSVVALLDALALLGFAFTGGDEPLCLDAADVDDNGTVSGLVDALYLLEWAFLLGDDPPDPGPEECGEDPTNDDVDCLGIMICP